MKWWPLFTIQMIESQDGKYVIKRKLYDDGGASHWWIVYKETPDAKPQWLIRPDSEWLYTYKTLDEAKMRVELHIVSSNKES